MNQATKKWIFIKVSSVILIPLMFWFIINFVSIYDQSYTEVLNFFTNKLNKFLFSLFIILAYFFSSLSISGFLRTILGMKKSKMSQIDCYIFLL